MAGSPLTKKLSKSDENLNSTIAIKPDTRGQNNWTKVSTTPDITNMREKRLGFAAGDTIVQLRRRFCSGSMGVN
jgi:hypothetical protein